MAHRRKQQEERNLKTLRELAAQPSNKQCFDCRQRGPTYINMTIGSFVCTACSGILRGLTPPHRVKSITMTTFSQDEIEFIKTRGNEYCRHVWLGRYDPNSVLEPEPRDDQRTKDFMIQKYERKRWYVDPEIAVRNMKLEEQKQVKPTTSNFTSPETPVPDVKPLSSILGTTSPPLVIQTNQTMPNSINRPSHPGSAVVSPAENDSKANFADMLVDLQGDFFASKKHENNISTANGNFADFEGAFSSNSSAPVSASLSAENFATFPTSFSQPASAVSSPPNPFQNQQPNIPQPPIAINPPPPSADRYAALADLDTLFHQAPQPTSSVSVPSWSVGNQSYSNSSVFSTAQVPSNPFGTSSPWGNQVPVSQHQNTQVPNPFQPNSQPSEFNAMQQMQPTMNANQANKEFTSPVSPLNPGHPSASNQANMYSSFSTGVPFNQQNGVPHDHVSAAPAPAWAAFVNEQPAFNQQFNTFQNYKVPNQIGNSCQWSQAQPTQSTANPFTGTVGMPVRRTNPGNPFL